MISINGHPPDRVQFCPACGSGNIGVSVHWKSGNWLLICHDCGLQCYIAEREDSHAEK